MVMAKERKVRLFKDYYEKTETLVSEKSVDALIQQEVGQNWDFMLTLRLFNRTTEKSLTANGRASEPSKGNIYNVFKKATQRDNVLLGKVEEYIWQIERRTRLVRRKNQHIPRSVYIHRTGDEYHAHIYSKYPLRMNPVEWRAILEQEWLKLPFVEGADNTEYINWHLEVNVDNSFDFCGYGFKDKECDAGAWIDDLSSRTQTLSRAMKSGRKRLERKGKPISRRENKRRKDSGTASNRKINMSGR
jgi:hypothetical protein